MRTQASSTTASSKRSPPTWGETVHLWQGLNRVGGYRTSDHCARGRGEKGNNALILYPVNARGSVPANRVNNLLTDGPALRGATSGPCPTGARAANVGWAAYASPPTDSSPAAPCFANEPRRRLPRGEQPSITSPHSRYNRSINTGSSVGLAAVMSRFSVRLCDESEPLTDARGCAPQAFADES